jgi:hypothetical protein
MKKTSLLLISLFFLIAANAQKFTLVNEGKSKCRIIIPERASVNEIQAAMVFQNYIQRISGATLPIASDKIKTADGEVLIGNVNRDELKDVPKEKLGKDGLYIKNTDKKLVITGGTGKGVLYGVYTFLEKYTGCRKYSSDVTYVPKQKTIVLNSINDTEIPSFAYREQLYPDGYDAEYMAWHKLDAHYGNPDTGIEWGSFVHTFDALLSTKEYGVTHPEYFSFYNGERHPGATATGRAEAQLCLSNPEVLEIVCKNLQTLIMGNPGALYWSVSQNDNVNYCRCPKCTELDEKYASFTPGSKMYGTHVNSLYSPIGMGSVLTFVNKVAERFPDKIISTLAYQYTRVPPKDLVPRNNVNIMLCNIESPRHVPIKEGDTSFCEDLEGWTRLTNNIIIWDYVVQYRNLISPFPNLHTLQPNLKYLHDKGVTMIFEEGNPETRGEFYELKTYILSKLMWDVDADVNKITADFLTGYYGKAGKIIGEYNDLLQKMMLKSGQKLLIYDTPVLEKNSFLTDSLLTEYSKIFDRAEKAVAGSPELLERVKVARLPVYYAILEIARDEKTGKRGAFMPGEGNKLIPKPEIVTMLYDFVHLSTQKEVSHVRERRITPAEYLEAYTKFLAEIPSQN